MTASADVEERRAAEAQQANEELTQRRSEVREAARVKRKR